MMDVYVVEVEGADYDGRCYVLTAGTTEAALSALKKKYGKPYKVKWGEMQTIDESHWGLDADFELVPHYTNEHTARYYITAQKVH